VIDDEAKLDITMLLDGYRVWPNQDGDLGTNCCSWVRPSALAVS
jgi:hypothetical protein